MSDNNADNPEPVPPRRIAKRIAEIIFVLLLIAIIIFVVTPAFVGTSPHPPIHDLSNLRQIVVGLYGYVADHEGQFPDHIAELNESGYFDGIEEQTFISISDDDRILTDRPAPNAPKDWYRYGSYTYYPTAGLNESDVIKTSEFILIYSTPYGEHEMYAAAFMDGSAQFLKKDTLFDMIEKQDKLIVKEMSP